MRQRFFVPGDRKSVSYNITRAHYSSQMSCKSRLRRVPRRTFLENIENVVKNQCFQQRHQETSTISLDGSATVTQKSFRNVGKTSKTSIPGVNGWGGSLRGPNDGMVIQTDADAENHWKSLGKQRFHYAAYTFRNNCLLWRQCSPADGNGYQKKLSETWGKQAKSAKSNVLQIRGRCSARPGSVQCTDAGNH